MRVSPGRPLPALLAVVLALPACGKKGDPQAPLRRAPQGLSAFAIAQRGERVVVSLTVPSAYTDGSRLPVLDVELLRADTPGEFAKQARSKRLRAAPGESRSESEPLPAPGTPLRYAARVLAKGKPSGLTSVLALTVQLPPPSPSGLTVRRSGGGVSLDWKHSASSAAAIPALEPALAEGGVSPSPLPSPKAPASPGPAPALAAVAPAPTEAPARPNSGFWVYRRAATGGYADSLHAAPVAAPPFEDTQAAAETVCYVVRAVVSTDPVIESADSNEVCLPPPMPAPSPGTAAR